MKRLFSILVLPVFLVAWPATVMAEAVSVPHFPHVETVENDPLAAVAAMAETVCIEAPQNPQDHEACFHAVVAAVVACVAMGAATLGLACLAAVYAAVTICTCLSAVGFVEWIMENIGWAGCVQATPLSENLEIEDCGDPPDWDGALDDECVNEEAGGETGGP